jgi:hypothetical protein
MGICSEKIHGSTAKEPQFERDRRMNGLNRPEQRSSTPASVMESSQQASSNYANRSRTSIYSKQEEKNSIKTMENRALQSRIPPNSP